MSKELILLSFNYSSMFQKMVLKVNNYLLGKTKAEKTILLKVPLNLVDDTAVRSTFKTCNIVLKSSMCVNKKLKEII